MLQTKQILVSAIVLAASTVGLPVGLVACGQPGSLYIPTEAAAAHRATLPESLIPGLPPAATAPAAKPATQPASKPASP